jgi:hypothetical protein
VYPLLTLFLGEFSPLIDIVTKMWVASYKGDFWLWISKHLTLMTLHCNGKLALLSVFAKPTARGALIVSCGPFWVRIKIGCDSFHEKPTSCSTLLVAQLVSKFPPLMEPVGSLPSSLQYALGPYSDPVESSPYPVSLRSILILSFHLCIGLPIGLVPSGCPTKILYAFISYAFYMSHPSPPWFDHTNNIFLRVIIMKLFIIQFSSASSYLFLNCKYSLHLVLTHSFSVLSFPLVSFLLDHS